ncbi:polysaccharide deacetylase family protein [Sphingobacterium lactis]|uniref:polysaccharide deacetylase family protein n=1 Tax=Sphingobacterium lactis TaxID=797291 RepID=UPI003EC7EAFE
MHFVRPIFFLPYVYNKSIWRKEKKKNNIYLTFDDGPIPELTPWVLDILKERNIKATFFCVGENIVKHPEIFERIKNEGHAVGNHTHNHLKGWATSDEAYFQNVQACQELTQTDLFRPPYGRATRSQLRHLAKTHRIIMWDVLTGDYDSTISPDQVYRNAVDYVRNGSIIVFHDNIKAKENLQYALPKSLDELLARGFRFDLF